jgi:hypothetical protein
MTESRLEWKDARAALDAIEVEREALLEPTKERFGAAIDRLDLAELATGTHIGFCEGCSQPIFEGDSYHSGEDVYLCAACSPSYADMVAHPKSFRGENDEPMSQAEADGIAQAHAAAGGSLDDKLVSP